MGTNQSKKKKRVSSSKGESLTHRSLQVDNLRGKINIGQLIEDTEKSQFRKAVVVSIGENILLTCSLIFPYYQRDPTIFNKVLLSQLETSS